MPAGAMEDFFRTYVNSARYFGVVRVNDVTTLTMNNNF